MFAHLTIKYIPKQFMDKYNLWHLEVNGSVYTEVMKGMHCSHRQDDSPTYSSRNGSSHMGSMNATTSQGYGDMPHLKSSSLYG